jgi:putative tRNA adenosine deaminase-associated protein
VSEPQPVPEAYAVLVQRGTGTDGPDGDIGGDTGGDAGWDVGPLPEALASDLDGLIRVVQRQPVDGAFALVDVAGEFFVVVREHGSGVRLLLSDVTAAAEWDLADQVLDCLGLDVPDDDELDRVEPAGDLDLFDDLGLGALEVAVLLSDLDAYADELLSALAARLGFGQRYERVVDALNGH